MQIEKLSTGKHKSPADGACIMELVSLLAKEPWSDRPACASASITSWCIWINDSGDQEHRDILLTLAPRIIGTRDWKKEAKRAALFSDFAHWSAEQAAKSAEYAAEYAAKYAEYAAKYAEYAAEYAEYAAEYAAKYAEYAAKYAEYAKSAAFRKMIYDKAIETLKLVLDV